MCEDHVEFLELERSYDAVNIEHRGDEMEEVVQFNQLGCHNQGRPRHLLSRFAIYPADAQGKVEPRLLIAGVTIAGIVAFIAAGVKAVP